MLKSFSFSTTLVPSTLQHPASNTTTASVYTSSSETCVAMQNITWSLVARLSRRMEWLSPCLWPVRAEKVYTDRQTDRETNRQIGRNNKQPNNQTTKQPNNQPTIQPTNQPNKQTNKQTTNRQTAFFSETTFSCVKMDTLQSLVKWSNRRMLKTCMLHSQNV